MIGRAGAAVGTLGSARFDDWTYRCINLGNSTSTPPHCEVVWRARSTKEENILYLAVTKVKQEFWVTALVPQNISLDQEISITIKEKNVLTIPFQKCNRAGCWARQNLDQQALTALRHASTAQASLHLATGERLDLEFSLLGFSKALNRLQKDSSN
jgi:invasion protein IalB